MEQEYFDDLVELNLARISGGFRDMNHTFEDEHISAQEVRREKQRDLMSIEVKQLIDLAVLAEDSNLNIPKNLSYFLIKHLNAQIYKTKDAVFIDNASEHVSINDSYAKEGPYLNTIMQIIMGHLSATLDVKNSNSIKEIKGDLKGFLSNRGERKFALSAEEYGYLLGLNRKKLTVEDAKRFFELHFHSSTSSIGKLFTKYKLNRSIKGYSSKKPTIYCT